MSEIDNKIHPQIDIAHDMEKSYTSYSGSVIIGRALPDVRDGFKPVHRRIVMAMHEAGMDFNKPYDKSAAIVGDVMKKYHPHGDSSIYDAVVRMAQPFTMGVNLIDGQGNFGSIDGDPAAAMRYTEVRMAKITHQLIHDIEKNTVEFRDTYNAARKEPVVLPAAFPNLLVNGSSGIAVGMATNIPPYNFTEIMEACIYCLENKNATGQDLLKIVKGPDFPTYGTILGINNVRQAMLTGKGVITIRGKATIESHGNRQMIVITEIPYQVNKAKMIEKIIELLKEKKIEGISDIRDETALEGIRVIIELKRDAIADVVLNRLYKYTPLQESFGINMVAIDEMRPKQMSLIEIIKAFLNFRIEVVTKRINFDLAKLRDKVHILIGLAIAIGDIDRVIAIIRSSTDTADARAKLLAEKWPAKFLDEISETIERDLNVIDDQNFCKLTEEQVKAILDLRLHKLTKLEKNKVIDEINQLAKEIQKCLILLNSPDELEKLIISELTHLKNEFHSPRKTQIVDANAEENIEDLMEQEDMVVTVTNSGYVKRVALDAYRTQSRGGKGKSGQLIGAEDCVAQLFTANTHVHVLFFFDSGYVYKTKVYKLPEGDPSSRGRAITNIFPVTMDSKIKKVIPLPDDEETWGDYEIIFVTSRGNIRRNSLEDFRNINSNGKIAIRFDDNEALPIEDSEEGEMPNVSNYPDYLIDVCLCKAENHVFIASYQGKAVHFPVNALRVFKSRTSNGVRAIRLAPDDYVISAAIVSDKQFEDLELRDKYLSIPYEDRMKLKTMEKSDFKSENYEGFDFEIAKDYAKNEELMLSVTENGFGKMTSLYDYRVTNRGGSGVTNILTTARNGGVVGSCPVELDDNIMLMTNKGKVIRINVAQIRISGRNTQGVTLLKVGEGEKIKSIAKVYEQE
jgi:DNA gyrase subunit A